MNRIGFKQCFYCHSHYGLVNSAFYSDGGIDPASVNRSYEIFLVTLYLES